MLRAILTLYLVLITTYLHPMMLDHTHSTCLLVSEEQEQARQPALLWPPHKMAFVGAAVGDKDILWKTANWEGTGLEKQNGHPPKSAIAGLPRLQEAFSISRRTEKKENSTGQMRARGWRQEKPPIKPGQQVPLLSNFFAWPHMKLQPSGLPWVSCLGSLPGLARDCLRADTESAWINNWLQGPVPLSLSNMHSPLSHRHADTCAPGHPSEHYLQ